MFDTNVTKKVGNIFPPHLTSSSALRDDMKKDNNSLLSLKCCVVALPDFNQSLT